MPLADIGLIGLAVMGQNLALNINDHGYKVIVYNRSTDKVDEFLNNAAKDSNISGAHGIEELVKNIKRPRKILLMVKAGEAVDQTIQQLLPYLEKGDLIIDGGNSLFTDTNRRTKELKEIGILFIGTGVSGGEEGARYGPSIMPGGNIQGWTLVKEMFQTISAHVEDTPCCDWVGPDGAGHYVKMIHNGIEYGDMQLICEAYDLLKRILNLNAQELHEVFDHWNQGELNSYLIEITSKIFLKKDKDGSPLVDHILDAAGQKGTGKWTVINALDLGIPLTLISEAVFARSLSALKEERVKASDILKGPHPQFKGNKEQLIEQIRQALYASKIISYAQGFMQMRQASKEYKWQLELGKIALLWRGGCIIRSRFLDRIKDAYEINPDLSMLLLDPFFVEAIESCQHGWRRVVALAAEFGIPTPCISAGLTFFDGYRAEKLPANLLQAQRDFFGAHTYERIDEPRGEYFHTQWE